MWNKDNSKLRSVFIGRTNNTFIQFFRYTFVGGFAFLVDFGTLFVLTEYFKTYYLVSAGVAFVLGLTVNYFLSVLWVFNNRTVKSQFLEFLIFVFIGIVGLGLTEVFLWFLTDLFRIHYLLSKIFTGVIVYLWNFVARKLILFNKQEVEQEIKQEA